MSSTPSESIRHVSREEIRSRLGDPSLALVDVLPAEAFASGHIPGSLSLPIAQINERAPQLLRDLDQEIVVYCGSFT
jgi:rhodanese-related sulfurtransferase